MNYTLTDIELRKKLKELRVGDTILLSGIIYTARDAAHKKFDEILKKGKSLPVDLQGSIIYYCGPCPAKPGEAIGSCGPTTSARMDWLTPKLISKGLKVTIGKGPRSFEVKNALRKYGAIYLIATGGAGALLSQKVKSSELVAFPELGPEAVYRLEVKDFPLIVANDSQGNDIFVQGGK